jgi:hypothetical protein
MLGRERQESDAFTEASETADQSSASVTVMEVRIGVRS